MRNRIKAAYAWAVLFIIRPALEERENVRALELAKSRPSFEECQRRQAEKSQLRKVDVARIKELGAIQRNEAEQEEFRALSLKHPGFPSDLYDKTGGKLRPMAATAPGR